MDAGREFEQRAAQVDPKIEVPPVSPVPGRAGYGWIDFTGLPNTRDLGGLIGAEDRRVKRGLLLRSGALGFASTADLARLREDYDLRLVVDLRNDDELAERPDPMAELPEATYLHASILTDQTRGITQEKETAERAHMAALAQDDDPVAFMALLYPYLLLAEPGLVGYRALFEAVLACEGGAALWHCSVGRDRCGMASVLIETALGVDRASIEGDYLATNVYAPKDITESCPASMRSLNAVAEAVDREFGGFMGYIREALDIPESAIKDLRARYLER